MAVIVAIVLALVFNIPGIHMSTLDMLLNFTMVQRWFLVPNVNDAFWTLAVEMQFYGLLFILLLVTRCRLTPKVIAGVGAAWLAVSLVVAIIAFPWSHGISTGHVALPVRVLLNVTLAQYGPLFVYGVFGYLSRRSGRIHLLFPIAGAVCVAATWLLDSGESAAIVAGIVLVFAIVVLRRDTRILRLGVIQWFGKISYSLYIIHSLVGYVVIHYSWPVLGRDGAAVLAFAVVTGLGWGLYELAETRGSRAFRRQLLAGRERIDATRRRGRAAVPGRA